MSFDKQSHQDTVNLQNRQLSSTEDMNKESMEIAKGTTMLTAGMGLGSIAAGKGMFDDAGSRFGGLVDRAKGAFSGDIQPGKPAYELETDVTDPSLGGGIREVAGGSPGSETAGWQDGEFKGAALGGASGGMVGSGLAKALGAKKKWQTTGAGVLGGLAGAWLGGGNDAFSIGMGGLFGGGLGMLI